MSEQSAIQRAKGNDYFRQNKFFEALRCYEAAVSLCPETDKKELSILYSNLSFAQLKVERTNEALESAARAIEYDPTNTKAYYRQGQALQSSLDFKGAYDSFLAAAKIQPNVKFWRDRMEEAKKKFRGSKLREAMSSDNLLEEKTTEKEETLVDTTPLPEFTVEYARQLMDEMSQDKRPSPHIVNAMIAKMKEINLKMDNIVKLERKGIIRVVGDTHGQYQDLRHIFTLYGEPSSENPYLFNGDYVDRGSMGIEIVLALFAWKLAIPDSIYMNRGNQYVFLNNNNVKWRFEK